MALNVLVVDDSAVMRAMIIRTLRLSGLSLGEVYEAPDGEQGLKVLAQAPVDLLLVDLNMPVMDGEEMVDEVRANPDTQALPIVVVSTEGSFTRIALLREKGAEFVHKPFSPESLRETVMEVTGGAHDQPVGQEALLGGGPDF